MKFIKRYVLTTDFINSMLMFLDKLSWGLNNNKFVKCVKYNFSEMYINNVERRWSTDFTVLR